MADACSPHGLSGSPDERRNSEHPWMYLQTWREHLEVLVGAPPRGKATFPSSCRASTQAAHKTGNLGGPARLVREVEVTHLHGLPWKPCVFFTFPWVCWEECFENLSLHPAGLHSCCCVQPFPNAPLPLRVTLLAGLLSRLWNPRWNGEKGALRGFEIWTKTGMEPLAEMGYPGGQ